MQVWLIDVTIFIQNLGEAIEQGDVSSRYELQVDIRIMGELDFPRIDDDKWCAIEHMLFDPSSDNGVSFGGVCPSD